MARWKDSNINLPGFNADGTRSWDSIKVGLLMDIRDELKELNGRARDASYQREIIRSTIVRMDRRMAKLTKVPRAPRQARP